MLEIEPRLAEIKASILPAGKILIILIIIDYFEWNSHYMA